MLFTDSIATFHVCTTCGHLFQGLPDSEQPQRCKCREDKDTSRWQGYDFNQRAALCRCCSTVVLKSGSRWLVWFCNACMQDVKALQKRHGGWVIPIGPHSMLHGISLAGEDGHDERAVEAFSKALGNLSQAIDILSNWSDHRVIEFIEELGFTINPSVRLEKYLDYARELAAEDPLYSRDCAFAALRATFGVPSIQVPNLHLVKTKPVSAKH